MKHNLRTTLFIVLLFLATQIMGVLLVNNTLDISYNQDGSIDDVRYSDLNSGFERNTMNEYEGIVYFIFGISLGTVLLVFLLKNKKRKVFRIWFLLGVFLTVFVTLSEIFVSLISIFIAALLAFKKVYKNDFYTNILTEILMYPALALLFVDFLTIKSIFIILGLISVYDYIAVYKSKHMVYMAKEMTSEKLFMGFMLPNDRNLKMKDIKTSKEDSEDNSKLNSEKKVLESTSDSANLKKTTKKNIAILGGGDISFPLLFNSVMLKTFGLSNALLSVVIVSIGLLFFLLSTKKGKFYPAMPPLAAFCFIAYLVILLI